MPVHIDELTSEVAAFDGDVPLSEKQLARIVEEVLVRLEEKRREAARARDATALRLSSRRPVPIAE